MRHITLHRVLAWNGPLVTLLALTVALAAGLLLIRLPPLGGVLFVGLAVVVVGTLIEPLVGLATALFLGLLRAYLAAEVPQVPAQIGHVFVALTLAVWLVRGLARRELRIPPVPFLLPLLLFIGTALVSLWDAVELQVYGLPEFIKWVQILLLCLYVAHHVDRGRLPWLLAALLLIGLFQAGVGIWQFGLRGTGPDHFAIVEDRFYRAYGTFEQPNPYAGYLGLMLPLAFGPLAIIVRGKLVNWYIGKLVRRHPSYQSTNLPVYQSTNLLVYQSTIPLACPTLLVGGVSTLAMLAALAMSWSRGAWLAFGAAVLVMAVALPRRSRWGLLLVGTALVVGLALHSAGLLPPAISGRLTDFAQYVRFEDVRGVDINDANYAVLERLAHWQAALEMLRHNLWTGVGFGGYEPAYPDFDLINWPIALGHAHNIYLNLAAEAGLVGLVAYLLLWGAIFWQTWRATRRAQGLARGLAIGLLGSWTHLSVHHLFDNLYVNNAHLHLGVLLGLLAVIIQQTNQPANRPTSQPR